MNRLRIVPFFVLGALLGSVGCSSEVELKKENLKLQEEMLTLRQENVELKEKVESLAASYQQNSASLNLMKIQDALNSYYVEMMALSFGASPTSEGPSYSPNLEALVPKYLPRIPDGKWSYDPTTGEVRIKY